MNPNRRFVSVKVSNLFFPIFSADANSSSFFIVDLVGQVTRCTFLENNLCSIHEFKPFTCRIFPFQLIGKEPGVFDISIHNSNICKSILNVKKEESNNAQILTDILNEVKSNLGLKEVSDRSFYEVWELLMTYRLLSEESDVHFTHNRGFIAKTSGTEISRLKELLLRAKA